MPDSVVGLAQEQFEGLVSSSVPTCTYSRCSCARHYQGRGELFPNSSRAERGTAKKLTHISFLSVS